MVSLQQNIVIIKIISGLFLSKRIVYKNGKPAFLSDLSKAFEWVFNIQLKDYHQKHEDVIKRKPGKITGFLNGLAFAMIVAKAGLDAKAI